MRAHQVKIEAQETEVARLAAGELPEDADGLPGLGSAAAAAAKAAADAAAAEESSDSESDEGGGILHEFEKSVPVLGDKAGREVIKAENRRILKFAEKRRKKISKSISTEQLGDIGPDGGKASVPLITNNNQMEKEVLMAAKQELRRMTVISSHHTRLSFLKERFDEDRTQEVPGTAAAGGQAAKTTAGGGAAALRQMGGTNRAIRPAVSKANLLIGKSKANLVVGGKTNKNLL